MTTIEEVRQWPDGTYLLKRDGEVDNYGERWGYGYIVGLRPAICTDFDLTHGDSHLLFGVWRNARGEVEVDVVKHVDSGLVAYALAQEKNQRFIWSLYENVEKEVPRGNVQR